MFSFKRCKLSTRAVLDINGRRKVICGIKYCLCLYVWSVAIHAAFIQYCMGGTWSVTRCLYLRKCFRYNMSETIKKSPTIFWRAQGHKKMCLSTDILKLILLIQSTTVPPHERFISLTYRCFFNSVFRLTTKKISKWATDSFTKGQQYGTRIHVMPSSYMPGCIRRPNWVVCMYYRMSFTSYWVSA